MTPQRQSEYKRRPCIIRPPANQCPLRDGGGTAPRAERRAVACWCCETCRCGVGCGSCRVSVSIFVFSRSVRRCLFVACRVTCSLFVPWFVHVPMFSGGSQHDQVAAPADHTQSHDTRQSDPHTGHRTRRPRGRARRGTTTKTRTPTRDDDARMAERKSEYKPNDENTGAAKIGRASCRERV